jgi:hypothetical protein
MKKNLVIILTISFFAISCSSNQSISKDRPEIDWGNYNVAGTSSERK